MKKLIPVMSLMLVFAFGSCEKETIEQTEVNPQNLEVEAKSSFDDSSETEAVLFERRLAWFSYLTVKVVEENPGLRAHVNNLISANNTIQANQLLIPAGLPGSPAFTFVTEFRQVLYDQLNGVVPDPDHDRDKPGVPIIPIPDPLMSDPIDMAIDDYIDYLTVDNCVELYFPKGAFNYVGLGTTFASVAHPLTTADWNDGIKRYLVLQTDPSGIKYQTEDITVNSGYKARNNNILVARPKVTFTCGYGEYSEIDFTDFLD